MENLTKDIIIQYQKQFKGSIAFSSSAGNLTFITFLAAKDKADFINGIWQNDPLNFRVILTETPAGLKVEFSRKSVTCKPKTNYMAYGSERFRATGAKEPTTETKAQEKVFKAFNELEKTLKSMFENDLVHKNHVELLGGMIR